MIVALLAALALAAPSSSPTPAWNVTSRPNGAIVAHFNLDPANVCQPYDVEAWMLEPDLGEDGTDTCGPRVWHVTIILRNQNQRARVFKVAETGKRGVWRATVKCGWWSATLVNPWLGRNLIARGQARCSA